MSLKQDPLGVVPCLQIVSTVHAKSADHEVCRRGREVSYAGSHPLPRSYHPSDTLNYDRGDRGTIIPANPAFRSASENSSPKQQRSGAGAKYSATISGVRGCMRSNTTAIG